MTAKPRKKHQLNILLSQDERNTFDRIEADTKLEALDLARALIRQLLAAYDATGRLPIRLSDLPPDSKLATLPANPSLQPHGAGQTSSAGKARTHG